MILSFECSPGVLPGEGNIRLSDLQRSVLLTVLYADLFDYPLRESELYDRIVLRHAGRRAVKEAVEALTDRFLTVADGFVVWKGREPLLDVRRRREAAGERLWSTAHRYARWLSRVPFVRMIAVSGSLAVNNAEERGDVDLFCVMETNRLWVARLFIVPLSKLTRAFDFFFPNYLCPNYLITFDALEVEDRNLFTAHEVAQAVPIHGSLAHATFLRANEWVDRFLPHRARPAASVIDRTRPVATLAIEWILSGHLGDVLDRLAHRAFLAFYRRRAWRSGWSWSSLEQAYTRNRYTVPEGGYISVVRSSFANLLRDRLNTPDACADYECLFPTAGSSGARTVYDWDGLFKKEYGRTVASEVEV